MREVLIACGIGVIGAALAVGLIFAITKRYPNPPGSWIGLSDDRAVFCIQAPYRLSCDWANARPQ